MSSHQGSAVASRAVPSYRARQSSAAQVPMRRTGSRVSRRRVRRVRERRGPAGGGGGEPNGGGRGGGGGAGRGGGAAPGDLRAEAGTRRTSSFRVMPRAGQGT